LKKVKIKIFKKRLPDVTLSLLVRAVTPRRFRDVRRRREERPLLLLMLLMLVRASHFVRVVDELDVPDLADQVRHFLLDLALALGGNVMIASFSQGCQIFLDTMYQNGENFHSLMALKYTKWM
jgi:predicted esterase